MMLDIRVGSMGDQLHLESRKGLIVLKILQQERKRLLSYRGRTQFVPVLKASAFPHKPCPPRPLSHAAAAS